MARMIQIKIINAGNEYARRLFLALMSDKFAEDAQHLCVGVAFDIWHAHINPPYIFICDAVTNAIIQAALSSDGRTPIDRAP